MKRSEMPHIRELLNRPKRNKYGAVKTKVDGITFDSKKEAEYYEMLKLAVQHPEGPLYFLRQVPFDFPGNTKYRCDFMVVYPDGKIQYIDVKSKGTRTKAFVRNKKQVEALYPVIIEER